MSHAGGFAMTTQLSTANIMNLLDTKAGSTYFWQNKNFIPETCLFIFI